ncbi:MAG: cytochrome c family protein, partial [Deltaproteobacteria bacterium]|nr:cytochrome c family protein [Deltaproteobacteria bacterium]
MKRANRMASLLGLVGVALTLVLLAPATPSAAENEFVGVKDCGKCHKKEKEGNQLGIWEKSKHSEAFKNLGTPKAKERAAKVGVTTEPQKSTACLVCHTTGHDEPAARFDKDFKKEDGVQCEACHGAGGGYKKKKTMEQITEERKKNKGVSKTAKETGLIIPDENTCKTCHAEQITFKGQVYKNPSYEPFDYKKMWEKIKHP